MSISQDELEAFYQQRVTARRQLVSQGSLRDKFNNVAAYTVVLLLLATVFTSINQRYELVPRFFDILWKTIVFIIPSGLIFAIDEWKNPDADASMESLSLHSAKTAAIKRIIGLDSTSGMMASVYQARKRAFSVTGNALGLKLDSDSPPGLGNHDNSCYQNSILQGLSSLDAFPQYLSDCVSIPGNRRNETTVAQSLKTLLSDLNDDSNNGRTLWTPRILKSMSSWTQQDAQEYYSKILDDIDKGVSQAIRESKATSGLEEHSTELNGPVKENVEEVAHAHSLRNPLEGLLAQRVACVQCGHSDGLSFIPFNCLTLSLGLDKNRHDIFERMDAYTKMETIDGVECPKCTLLKAQRLLTKLLEKMRENGTTEEQLSEPVRRLAAVELALEEDDFDEKTLRDECKIAAQSKVTSTKTKQIVIGRPPKNLVIHLNRSVFDPSTFNMMKNSAPVAFPTIFELGPWCLGSSAVVRRTPDSALSISKDNEEYWQIDPSAPMAASDFTPSKIVGPTYELRAAVTHYGRHENGHYICYRKQQGSAAPPPTKTVADEPEDTSADKEDITVDEPNTPASAAGETTAAAEDGPAEEAASAINGTAEDEIQNQSDEAEGTKSVASAEEPNVEADADEEGKGRWWRLSDHNVSEVDEESLADLAPGVFMLFYECVEPGMVFGEEGSKEEPQVPVSKAETSTPSLPKSDDECALTERSSIVSENDDDTTLTTIDTATDDGTVTTVTSIGDDSDAEQFKIAPEPLKTPLMNGHIL